MPDDIHVVRDAGTWRVRGPDVALSFTEHASKTAAIDKAKASASQSGLSKVVVHNDDGSIDYLEHGLGASNESPESLTSPSGSNLAAVNEKFEETLSRGVEAILKQRGNKLGDNCNGQKQK